MKRINLYKAGALLLLLLSYGYNRKVTANHLHGFKVTPLQQTPFPDFLYPDTLGNKISLDHIKGKKATLVVFWASWCAPCRKEIPGLKAFYKDYKSKGVSIVSISVDQNINAWKKAVREEKMPWPNLANLPADGQLIMTKFNIKAVPTMFLLDTDGTILLTDPTLDEVLAKVKMR